MRQGQRFRVLGATMVLAGVALAWMLVRSPGVKAHDDDDEDSLVKIGFAIAPVHLNLEGKNRHLVGLGSFIVNAQALTAMVATLPAALQTSITRTAGTRTLANKRKPTRPLTSPEARTFSPPSLLYLVFIHRRIMEVMLAQTSSLAT